MIIAVLLFRCEVRVLSKVYVGMTGLRIRVDTGIDLSSASKVALKVRKPSGVEEEWIGFANRTYIEYDVQSGDLDETGFYKIQAYVELPGNIVLYGETDGIYVYEQFD